MSTRYFHAENVQVYFEDSEYVALSYILSVPILYYLELC